MEHEAQECKFCRLINGQEKCYKVYEDAITFAFLDKHPINPGHLLVIPKQHIADFYSLEERLYSLLMLTVKNLAQVINKEFKPKKVGLIIAGFDIPHLHVHIIPMYHYNDIGHKYMYEGKPSASSPAELKDVAGKIIKMFQALSFKFHE